MGIGTLIRYLIGDREAILTIAGSRHSLWIGFLFVLSAGFAREYDHEDLLHEPWYLLLPMAASLGASLGLFTLTFGIPDESLRTAPSRYLSFLGLFWLTAPLAWLYAVPYERFLDPADAMRCNLLTLAVVSVWRVALMVRVFVVLLNFRVLAALAVVMLFADVLAIVLLFFRPVPLLALMAGLRLDAVQRVQRDVAGWVMSLGCYSIPLWVLLLIKVGAQWSPRWEPTSTPSRPTWTLGALALVSIAGWAAVLPFTQPEQIRRRSVEKAFARGHIADALEEMSRHERSDYPPGWEPPPAAGKFIRTELEQLVPVFEAMAEQSSAEWVRERYLERLADILSDRRFRYENLEPLISPLLRIPDIDLVVKRLEARGATEHASQLQRKLEEARTGTKSPRR